MRKAIELTDWTRVCGPPSCPIHVRRHTAISVRCIGWIAALQQGRVLENVSRYLAVASSYFCRPMLVLLLMVVLVMTRKICTSLLID